MVSVYEYITVADLESFTANDYDAVDAAFINAVVDANISMAERWVNSYCKTTFTGTIPDEVVYATTLLADFYMKRLLWHHGHRAENEDQMQAMELRIKNECREALDNRVDGQPITWSNLTGFQG